MGTVLVAYATRNGSTRQVAVAMAEAFASAGHWAECRGAHAVKESVAGFDLVVLGAPIYSGRWHRHAHRFLKRHRASLSAVAVFGLGPRDVDAEAWQRSRAQLDRALAKHPWLSPVDVALFGGVDPPGKRTHRDLRDWDAIRAWVTTLACLHLTAHHPREDRDHER